MNKGGEGSVRTSNMVRKSTQIHEWGEGAISCMWDTTLNELIMNTSWRKFIRMEVRENNKSDR